MMMRWKNPTDCSNEILLACCVAPRPRVVSLQPSGESRPTFALALALALGRCRSHCHWSRRHQTAKVVGSEISPKTTSNHNWRFKVAFARNHCRHRLQNACNARWAQPRVSGLACASGEPHKSNSAQHHRTVIACITSSINIHHFAAADTRTFFVHSNTIFLWPS